MMSAVDVFSPAGFAVQILRRTFQMTRPLPPTPIILRLQILVLEFYILPPPLWTAETAQHSCPHNLARAV